MKGRINKQINIGSIYNNVCASLVALFSWQQNTNLAAVMAHVGISPDRYGSLSMFDLFSNSLRVCGLCGKYVSLMWAYISLSLSITELHIRSTAQQHQIYSSAASDPQLSSIRSTHLIKIFASPAPNKFFVSLAPLFIYKGQSSLFPQTPPAPQMSPGCC